MPGHAWNWQRLSQRQGLRAPPGAEENSRAAISNSASAENLRAAPLRRGKGASESPVTVTQAVRDGNWILVCNTDQRG